MSQAPAPEQRPDTPPAEVTTTVTSQEQTIPYARFKEVNDALAELKRKDAEREAKERAETEKRAKEQGQYKELVEAKDRELGELKPQVESATARTKALEEVMEAQVKERAKALPDELRAMMPDGDVLAQFAWLGKAEAAAAKLQIARSPGTPPGPRGSGAQSSPGAVDMEALKAEKRARIGGL
jgi:hypothetical protein